jgi:hypothetical protein
MPDIPLSFDRPISGDCRERSTDSSVTPGIVLAALIAILFSSARASLIRLKTPQT